MLDGEDLYGPDVDPVNVRRTVGHGVPEGEPVPDDVDLRQRHRRLQDRRHPQVQGRAGRHRRALAEGREPVGRGQAAADPAGCRAVRRAAAAAVHRPGDRGGAVGVADGRAVLGAGPDLHPGDRGPDRRAEGQLHDRHRHPQHAAGGAGVRPDRVLQPGRRRPARQTRRVRRHHEDLLQPDAKGHRGLHLRPLRLSRRRLLSRPSAFGPSLRPQRRWSAPKPAMPPESVTAAGIRKRNDNAPAPDGGPARSAFGERSALRRHQHGSGVAADVLAGDQEDDPAGDGHRMVGEPLVEPGQQSDVDGRADAMTPGRVQHRGEQLPLQVVHQVVLDLEPPGQVDVALPQDDTGLVGQVHADPAHPLDDRPDLRRDDVGGMTTTGGLGDVDGQRAHPLQVRDDPDRRHHGAQVGGHRRLQRQQLERDVLGVRPHLVQPDIGGDHLLGQGKVGVQQSLGCIAQCITGDHAHRGTVFAEIGESHLIGLSHESRICLRRTPSGRPR